MHVGSRVRWTILLLVGGTAVAWFASTIYPDQVFSAYLQTRCWLAVAGPIQKLSSPGSTHPNAMSAAPEQSLARFVVLPASPGVGIAKGGTWTPTTPDINGLENSLLQVSTMKAEDWPTGSDIRINHPEQYFRQYVAVVQKGRRLIYVNAFCEQAPVSYWRQQLVTVFDGGTCCWQALYDPATMKFSALRINGIA